MLTKDAIGFKIRYQDSPGYSCVDLMTVKTTKNLTLALGVASMATSLGNVAVHAGPALQTLNNLTNTAEFTITNTYGQSFSVDGMIDADVRPFANATAIGISMSTFTAGTATLTTGFQGGSFGNYVPVGTVNASVEIPTLTVPIVLNSDPTTGLAAIILIATGGTQTIGASISSTLFGPSTVRATSSFTNQLINDLSAF